MRIGLVPVSAKPYHRGHHVLVERAAQENDAVVVFVSTSDRRRRNEFPVVGTAMIQVWKEELESIMPSNSRVEYGGSPVRKVYELIEVACEDRSSHVFTIYSDVADTASNYDSSSREKYMSPLCEDGQVIFAAEVNPDAFTRGLGTPDVRGEDVRSALAKGNFDMFAAAMPAEVNARVVFDILRTAAGIPKSTKVFAGGRF